MSTHKCHHCKTDKTADQFYTNLRYSNGLCPTCKECCRALSAERRKNTKARNSLTHKFHVKKIERYTEKERAKEAVKKYTITGKHLHHWSYRKEHRLQVFLVTPTEHALLHKYTKYDPERHQYRTTENVLLDDMKEYITYIKEKTGLTISLHTLVRRVSP